MAGRSGRYKTYTASALEEAILFVKETGGSVKLAAREFGVPPSTINDHLKKRSSGENPNVRDSGKIDSDEAEEVADDNGVLKIPVISKPKSNGQKETSPVKLTSPRKRRSQKTPQRKVSDTEDALRNNKVVVKVEDDDGSYMTMVDTNVSETMKENSPHVTDAMSQGESTETQNENDAIRRKKYTKEKLFEAYEFLLTHPTSSITTVARDFGVPTTTLRDRWTGRVRVKPPTSFRPILPKPVNSFAQAIPHPLCVNNAKNNWTVVNGLINPKSNITQKSTTDLCISLTGQSDGFPKCSNSPVPPSPSNLQRTIGNHSTESTDSPPTFTENSIQEENKTRLIADNSGKEAHMKSSIEDVDPASFADIKIKQEPGVVDLSQVNFEDGGTSHYEERADAEIQNTEICENSFGEKKQMDKTFTVRLIYNVNSKKRGRRSYKLYPKEALEKAIQYIRDEGGSPSKASEIFGVPQSTIGDRLRHMGIIRRPKQGMSFGPRKNRMLLNNNSKNEEEESSGVQDYEKSDPNNSGLGLTTLSSEITSYDYTDVGKSNVEQSHSDNQCAEDESYIIEENILRNGLDLVSEDGKSENGQEDIPPVETSYVPKKLPENHITDSNDSSQDSQSTIVAPDNSLDDLEAGTQNNVQSKEGMSQDKNGIHSGVISPMRDHACKRPSRNKKSAFPVRNTSGNYKSYSQEDLQKACDYVMIWNKTVAEASRLFGVPNTTIWDKIKKEKTAAEVMKIIQNKTDEIVLNMRDISKDVSQVFDDFNKDDDKNGRISFDQSEVIGDKRIFKSESWVQARLSWYLFEMAEIGYRFSEDEIIQIVSELKRDCCPNDWLCRLLDTYPALSNVLGGYNFSIISGMVNFYYNKLDRLLEKKELFKYPELLYMIDMSCVVFEKKSARIVEAHRFTPSSLMVNDVDMEVVTIVGCANALGTALPPFFISSVYQPLPNEMHLSCPGAQCMVSKNGRCTTTELESYILEHFCRFCQSGRDGKKVPVVVLYNPYQAPVRLSLLMWAEENNIHFFPIPPHTYSSSLEGDTKQLSSFDVGLFGNEFEKTLISECVSQYSQVNVLTKAYKKTLTSDHVITRFMNNGTFPVNLKRYGKLKTERLTESPSCNIPFIKKEPTEFNEKQRCSVDERQNLCNSAITKNTVSDARTSNVVALETTKTESQKVIDIQENQQQNVSSPNTSVHRRKRKGQPKQAVHMKVFKPHNCSEKETIEQDGQGNVVDNADQVSGGTGASNTSHLRVISTANNEDKEGSVVGDEDIMTVAGYKVLLAIDDDDDEEEES